MIRIAVAIFIAAFFLFRPYALQNSVMAYGGDDDDYFAQASAIVFGQFPSYKKEFHTLDGPKESVGPGILAVPFVFAFSWIDRLEGSSIATARTKDNIYGSWSQFGFMLSSVFYFCLACRLLYSACLYVAQPSFASWAVILMGICQGMPLFAFRRPIFSHTSEFFLQSVMVYLLLRNTKTQGEFLKRWWAYMLVGAAATMIFLVRYNNLMIALCWPLLLLTQGRINNTAEHVRRLLWAFIPFIALILFFKMWPEVFNQYDPYPRPWENLHWAGGLDQLKHLWHIFFGFDWGLAFTAPFLLLGCWSLMKFDMPAKQLLGWAAVALLGNVVTIFYFGSQGGWYGYRYLIASAFPVFVVPLSIGIQRMSEKFSWKAQWALFLIALLPVMSMVCFEGNPTTLTLQIIPQFFGRSDWGNASYQISVWLTGLNIQTLFKGGVFYIFYILHVLGVSWGMHMNDTLAKIYPHFEWKILVKTLMFYAVPFGACLFFSRPTAGPDLLAHK